MTFNNPDDSPWTSYQATSNAFGVAWGDDNNDSWTLYDDPIQGMTIRYHGGGTFDEGTEEQR